MKHVLIAIAAHCQPEILKYTLGTWLETYDGTYKVTVCVSLATDFEQTCKRTHEILEMAPYIEFIRVPKYIGTDNERSLFEFSAIHANCLRSIFAHCQDIPFTHVAVLDHDLEFKTDFIKWAIEQDADWVGNLFNDRTTFLKTEQPPCDWALKCSVWHCVLSRNLYDHITEDRNVLMPEVFSGALAYDTMSKAFELMTCDWNMDVRVYPEAEIEKRVKHLWSLSFDYGQKNEGHHKTLEETKRKYESRFPGGISHLLERL